MSITFDGELNTITSSGNEIKLGSSSVIFPSGNTLQRPSLPVPGTVRYNTQDARIEGFNGNTWIKILV